MFSCLELFDLNTPFSGKKRVAVLTTLREVDFFATSVAALRYDDDDDDGRDHGRFPPVDVI